ncbi:uncharacterized protein LOC131946715 [Physella acuta]|uniref:uncharacterized protein LOC131946715 n=1 Tax=Physella acuta TaxID=109671 RepID=UPI0027DC1132|nr:uncharacterized protein LOC131946715 [Physella acuta]
MVVTVKRLVLSDTVLALASAVHVRLNVSIPSESFFGYYEFEIDPSKRDKNCIFDDLFPSIRLGYSITGGFFSNLRKLFYWDMCELLSNSVELNITVKNTTKNKMNCSNVSKTICAMYCNADFSLANTTRALMTLKNITLKNKCIKYVRHTHRPTQITHATSSSTPPVQLSTLKQIWTKSTTKSAIVTPSSNITISRSTTAKTTLKISTTTSDNMFSSTTISRAGKIVQHFNVSGNEATILGVFFGSVILVVFIVLFIWRLTKFELFVKQTQVEAFCIADLSEAINRNSNGAACSMNVYTTPDGEWDTEDGHRHRDVYSLPGTEDNYSTGRYQIPDVIKGQVHLESYGKDPSVANGGYQDNYIDVTEHYVYMDDTLKRGVVYDVIDIHSYINT